ncbi:MAG: hypothetical protein GF317_05670 [Candidatus Lokiarchaeota archaeon]|nr:hypothetical protein [Candidatus Lokiarchaeota archaeon]MBD3199296.1 hypothetical protein [Candidatus Lokiarchaeota archaeon]
MELFREIIPKVYKFAPDAVDVIASNPVDILAYATYKITGKNHKEIIGSGTTLDTSRLRFKLSNNCKIDPRNVHAYILGEHGDSEFPIWSKAMIGGLLFKDYCKTCIDFNECNPPSTLEKIFTEVRDSAYKIIDKKGETSYGIGLSLVRIAQAILENENAVLPISCLIEDFSEINDIYLSLPSVLNRNGVRETLRLELNEEEEVHFKNSAETLKEVLKNIGLQ